MKYMVVECHPGYAVVLDGDGRFLKVANLRYEVGQTVTDVFEMQVPQAVPQTKKAAKWIYSLAAAAACLMLAVTSLFRMGQMTYASVYMTINPEVRIDVNRRDVVVGLDGVNTDGEDLISGYVYQKKDLDLVMDELVDRAIDMGFLHEGGQISLVLDAESDEWVIAHGDALTSHLNAHLNEKLTVTIEVTDTKTQNSQAVIPVAPGESSYGDSDYGEITPPPQPPVSSDPAESDYSDSYYGDSRYDDSRYDDGQTDYGDHDGDDDGQSEYEDPDGDDDGESEYEDPDGDDDGESEYEDPDGDDGSDYDSDDDDDDDDGSDYDSDDDDDDDDDGSDYDSDDDDDDDDDGSDYDSDDDDDD